MENIVIPIQPNNILFNGGVLLGTAAVVNTDVEDREENKYPDSRHNANANAKVVTGAGESTGAAPYCEQLIDKAEAKRQEIIADYDKDDAYIKKWWSGIEDMPPHEILQNNGMAEEADHLRRCIELATDLAEEYQRLDAATKELERLNAMDGETYTTKETVFSGMGSYYIEERVHNIAQERQAALDQINSSLASIDGLENTRAMIGPDTEIDYWIKEAWKYDDRWFVTDVFVGAVPVVNAADSGYAATVYFNAGRPGMGYLMSGFAVADAASSAGAVVAGAGVVTGAATGVGKGVIKSGIKKALKKSSGELKSLFGQFARAGELVTSRQALRTAAETAKRCALSCVGR